ncbi:EamA family transporter [Lichenihabitans sp. PAMC28606]|uniref:EamA family transporter n=1 Tax=Lichenihabitans sp. PAMC28606 TaxID=2880932 RepID=UPI001D0AD3FA|nr:EamA family transporter [Lichenihabitans sp. PAMC28606]UDL96409.1 EamA family transporter [Lichenihabitans sp. PAMC28606]
MDASAADIRTAGGPSRAVSIGIVIVAMSSFQLGAALAKQLFPLVGPQGAALLRIGLSAMILWGLTTPWRSRFNRSETRSLLVYGIALAALNSFFYLAVQRIPLGIAVAIDFIGPLAVAIGYSRRWLDGFWVVLAACGIALLFPIGGSVAALDPIGVVYCLGSAAAWAVYILYGQKAGETVPSGRATAIGLGIASLLVLPFGVAEAGGMLLSWSVLPIGLLVAVLSSALPYNLEMVAMKRLPTRLFGVLMSLEPALGALFGWLILGEDLTLRQFIAIACVILASAGATLTASRVVPATDG